MQHNTTKFPCVLFLITFLSVPLPPYLFVDYLSGKQDSSSGNQGIKNFKSQKLLKDYVHFYIF